MSCLSLAPIYAKEWTVIRFGVNPSSPFESKALDGNLVGLDIDIGSAICVQLKVKCVWMESPRGSVIPGLKARKFDGILS
ncbi:transporter substrate-binding domain-containing protein [Pseudomonas lactis]|uniref:Transporter substrate-binding domain-containing protein n=1 Tax=Pseudomonas lactis TaxID=1615674 RepID=A0A7Y1QCW9_9PSED|nr:transporter substrate-binding domain-containing protein [Pseudomonas lactis]NNA82444.1 transporter substrate-binding domain-containing protein [Pseudomonas lactis]